MDESEHRMKVLEQAISHLYEDIHPGVKLVLVDLEISIRWMYWDQVTYYYI